MVSQHIHGLGDESQMNSGQSEKTSLKQKAIHEFEDFASLFVYLAFFFCGLTAYSMLLLHEFHLSYFTFGFALIKAFVIAKVILIGQHMHLGKKQEAKPLFFPAVYKAFLFTLLVFGFHLIEEVVKHLLRGGQIGAAFHEMRIDDLLARSILVFCTFVPLFAFIELRRLIGEGKFLDLFFRRGATKNQYL